MILSSIANLEREAEADREGNGRTVSRNIWECQLQQQGNMHNAGQHTGQPFMQPRPEKDMPLMMMSILIHYEDESDAQRATDSLSAIFSALQA